MTFEAVSPLIPERIDHYRMVRRIALGGMAEIFEAVDEKSGRTVALKKILPHIATDPDFLDRFFHEIRIQISLKHPNVVELLDCSPIPQHAYIVMEFVDGGELHSLRRQSGRFPWEIALYVAQEALRGLGAAHAKGVIHRDIKPQNIMWTRDGCVKIGDFGISHAAHLTRLTHTGTVVGTPAHMSPEQARGEELDARSDLFSMGTVLYELLCGYNPFTADSIAASLRRVAEIEPDLPSLLDPSIPPGVDTFLRMLHAKDRARRFASAAAACDALAALYEREGVTRPGVLFREFLENPAAFVAERNRRRARESTATAERLLKDRNAPPEEALWAAYQTVACTPDDPAAQTLLRTAALRAGQREKPLDNAKIRELEEALKKDPDSLVLLLQLAKLYRLEHDFLNLMRFFRKLQTLGPSDAYTRGQIASLLSGGESTPGFATRAVPLAAGGTPRTVPVIPREELSRAGLLAATGIVILVAALGLWWEKRAPRMPSGERLSGPAGAPTPVTLPIRGGDAAALEHVRERGALVERENGAAAALAFYEETLAATTQSESRVVVLSLIADLALKAQDKPRATKALDALLQIPAARPEALIRKGDFLLATGQGDAADRLFEEAARVNDPAVSMPATLRLARGAERSQNTVRATTLYEEILLKAPGSTHADEARLSLAVLYRAEGRLADARRQYEDVLRNEMPAGEIRKAAEAGLKALEGAPAAEARP
ncbi:MAG: protein kinase [Acidobacteriota bacterium]|nr:protein kinase [Acidobacteriota bacterium]